MSKKHFAAIRRLSEENTKLNASIQRNAAQQFKQTYPQLLSAMEFGYICCEKGLNIQAARSKFAELFEKETK